MSFAKHVGGVPGKIALFYSGSASSGKAMIEDRNRGSMYDIVLAITNNRQASGTEMLMDSGIPSVFADPSKAKTREDYFRHIMEAYLNEAQPDVLALSGWLGKYSLIQGEILKKYRNRIFNVHPAKLYLLKGPGVERLDVGELPSPAVARLAGKNKLERIYVGDDAVTDAVMAREPKVASTIFAVDNGKDTGTILVESVDFDVDQTVLDEWVPKAISGIPGSKYAVEEYVHNLQDKMKYGGDGPAFLEALDLFFSGRLEIGDVSEGAILHENRAGTRFPVNLPYNGHKMFR